MNKKKKRRLGFGSKGFASGGSAGAMSAPLPPKLWLTEAREEPPAAVWSRRFGQVQRGARALTQLFWGGSPNLDLVDYREKKGANMGVTQK